MGPPAVKPNVCVSKRGLVAQTCFGGDCVQSGSCIQLPQGAMELVGAALADQVSYRTAATAKFGGVRVCQDGHFLNCLKVVRLKGLALNRIIVIVLSVQQEVVGARTRAVHGEAHSVAEAVRPHIQHSGLGQHQRNCIQVEDRDFLNFYCADAVRPFSVSTAIDFAVTSTVSVAVPISSVAFTEVMIEPFTSTFSTLVVLKLAAE